MLEFIKNTILRKSLLILILIILSFEFYFLFLSKTQELNAVIEEMRLRLDQTDRLYRSCEIQRKAPLEPSLQYEIKRRKIRETIQNMWDFMQSSLLNIKSEYPSASKMIESLVSDMYEHKISLISNWLQMTQSDGYENWRKQEFKDLSNLVQNRFKALQNPKKDCKNAHLVTNGDIRPCGWGCQYVHYPDNFGIALALNRTLLYKKPKGHFYEPNEFEKYCEPITTSCNFTLDNETVVDYNFDEPQIDAKILRINDLRYQDNRTNLLPTNLPKNLYPRLEKLLEDPQGWWLGQIFMFLTKLRPQYQKMSQEIAKKLGLTKYPTMAIHIRRGNKIKEIEFQPVDAYMKHVKEFFDTIELSRSIDKRQVLVLSDDSRVILKLRKKYPDYEFLFNEDLSKDAQNYERHNQSALQIYLELQLVSMCDGWVGTFSSNLGRRHYDSQQWFHIDAKTFTKSLDFHYSEWGENPIKYIVNMPHYDKDNEFKVNKGDYVDLDYVLGQSDGHLIVRSRKSGNTGIVPSFKLDRIFDVIDIPIFNVQ